ncbi:unnamed protein product [Rhizopus microsporus]
MSTTVVKPWFKKYKPVDEWQYLKVKIWSDETLDTEITELSFRMSIQQALEFTFGQIGASCYVNVLGWNQYHNEGVIKSSKGRFFFKKKDNLCLYINNLSELTTVWSALVSYQFEMGTKLCAMDIVSSSAQLISLAEH